MDTVQLYDFGRGKDMPIADEDIQLQDYSKEDDPYIHIRINRNGRKFFAMIFLDPEQKVEEDEFGNNSGRIRSTWYEIVPQDESTGQ